MDWRSEGEKMVELSHWIEVIVPQRHQTGCIPTSYEWMIRYLDIEGVKFEIFQEDFDLGRRRNSYATVSEKIMENYPHICIKIKAFLTGQDKIDYIQKLLRKDIPCIISLKNHPRIPSWHSLPIVYINSNEMKGIWIAAGLGNQVRTFSIADIIFRHENWEGGKDISWIKI